MTTSFAYPYKVLPDAIQADVISSAPDVPREGSRFDLRALTEQAGAQFSFTVRCRLDPTKVSTVLPDGTGAESVQIGLREMSIGSHERTLHSGPIGVLDVTFPITIDIDSSWGSIEITPLLILAEDIPRQTGFACAKGSVLSWNTPFEVSLDVAEPPPGGSLIEIEWRDFAAHSELPDDGLYALEIEERPRLLLNSASPEAYDVLRSEATTGTKARLRDLTFASMALDVWSTLIRSAYDNLRAEVAVDPTASPNELLDGIIGWQGDVLKAWSPKLVGEADQESAISDLVSLAQSGDSDPLALLDRILQQELGTRALFDRLAQDALGD